MANRWGTSGNSGWFYLGGAPKSLQMVTAAIKLRRLLLGRKVMTNLAAKSLQSCPTLCNPIDSIPPGSPIPGILQARTLEWVCHFLLQCMKAKSESEAAQSCPTLRNPMDCSLPGFSVHRIFQARVLEWGAIAFSYYQPRQHIKEQRHYFANKGPSSSRLWFFQ